MAMIRAARVNASREVLKAEEEFGENVEVVGSVRTVTLKPEGVVPFQKWKRRGERFALAEELLPRSYLVALVGQYDAFLGGLIRALFLLRPDLLNASERKLSYSELMAFGSLDEARDSLVEKEIESVLRDSHSKQFDWLEGRFGVELRKGLSIWPEFVEVTERRNLFVHTSGIVSRQYVEVCRKHGVALGEAQQAGAQLGVTRKYLRRAYSVVLELGIKLAHVLWRKVSPSQLSAADDHLNKVAYELLAEQRFPLAACVLDFAADGLKKHANSEARLTYVVNRAQAHKWMGDEPSANAILSKEDWSAVSENFKLAERVLRDDFPGAIALMRTIGKDGSVGLLQYRTWPLFRKLREDQEFLSAFEEMFGEPLNRVTTEAALAEPETGPEPLESTAVGR